VLLLKPAGAGPPRPAPARRSLPWREARAWLLPPLSALAPRASPLADASGGPASLLFEARLEACGGRLAFLWDHIVCGQPMLPAAAMLEAASAAARTAAAPAAPAAALVGVAIVAPLLLPPAAKGGQGSRGGVLLVTRLDAATGSVRLVSSNSADSSGSLLHLNGSVCQVAATQMPASARVAALSWLARLLRAAAAPPVAATATGTPAPAATGLLPIQANASAFAMYPATLDCAFQLGAAHAAASQPAGGKGHLLVPAAVGAFALPSGRPWAEDVVAANGTAAAQSVPTQAGSTTQVLLCLGAQARCHVADLEARPLAVPAARRPAPGAASATAVAAARQQDEMLYETALAASEPWQEERRSHEGTLSAVSGASSLRLPRSAGAADAVVAVLSVVQAAAASGAVGAAALQLRAARTVGAPTNTGTGASEAGGALAGFMRAVQQEAASWKVAALSSSAADAASAAAPSLALGAQNVLPSAGEASAAGVQAGVHGSGAAGAILYAPVLRQSAAMPSVLGPHQLVPAPRGAFSGLVPAPVDVAPEALAPGQLGIRVQAVGLNFRDVLNVSGGGGGWI
jgi:hypothetical protein